jgi:endogenous inhibitor of DNA gyrase (YacG/DUF329 family)
MVTPIEKIGGMEGASRHSPRRGTALEVCFFLAIIYGEKIMTDSTSTKTCPICGRIFLPPATGRPRRFCSDLCRRTADRGYKPGGPWTCQQCGATWKGRKRKFCSPACSHAATWARYMATCKLRKQQSRGVVPQT